MNVQTASSAELLSFYNANAAKPVARFADRKTAERRVGQLLVELRAAEATADDAARGGPATTSRDADVSANVYGFADHGLTNCPGCGVHLANGVAVDGDEVNGKTIRLATQFECLGCGEGFGKKTRVGRSSNNADGVAASWADPEVRAARIKRDGVKVKTGEGQTMTFTSTEKAFDALGLPKGKFIAFRKELKRLGRAEGYGHFWTLLR